MSISKEAKTAIIILMGIGCLIVGFNFLKSTPIFSTNNQFYAVFDHSNGLQAGTAVTVNGVVVGAVESLKINPENAKIVVKFTCKDEFSFSKNSVAQIYSSLLGNTGLQIVPALDNAPKAVSGDYLKSEIHKGMMDKVSDQMDPTFVNLNKTLLSSDSLMMKVNHTLNAKMQQDIQQSMATLNQTLQSFNRVSASLERLLAQGSLDKTLKNLDTTSENFSVLSQKLAQSNMDKTLSEMEKTLTKTNNLLAKIEKGEGSLGQLLVDKKLYENLKTASSEMGLLMEDIRRNPKRYVHISVFGKNNKEYETPKNVEPSIAERAEQIQSQNP